MDFEVNTKCEEGTCIVRVNGEVDVYTSPELKTALVDALQQSDGKVIVDLDGVGFIDSSGLGVLVGALRRAREAGGDMKIVSARAAVEKILKITGLDRVFPLYRTVDEALGA